MRHAITLALLVLSTAVACKKKEPPNITGRFEGSAQQLSMSPSTRAPREMGTTLRVELSDEQEGSTAVKVLALNTVGGGALVCEARAPRTDRDDGASWVVPSTTCRFGSDQGVVNGYQAPCRVQMQALALRFDRASGGLSLDGAGFDLALTPTPETNLDACRNILRMRAPAATTLRRLSP